MIVLFIGIILGYEGNKAISISGIVVGLIFIVLSVYTWQYSFFENNGENYELKLPYRAKIKVSKPTLIKKWRHFGLYKLSGEFQDYSVLVFSRKKN